MIVSEVLTIGTGLVTFVSSLAASSCCVYIYKRKDDHDTLEKLRVEKSTLAGSIDALRLIEAGEAVVALELPRFIVDADVILAKASESIANFERDENCICWFLPDPWAQRSARSQMEKEVSTLHDWLAKSEKMAANPLRGYRQLDEVVIVGQERIEEAEKILNLVLSPQEGSQMTPICIHGAFGVGKTAIAKYIYNKALNSESPALDCFIWVDVGYGASLSKVQEAIAKSLNCGSPNSNCNGDAAETAPSDTDHSEERAEILNKALLQRGKFLMVLDSISRPLSDSLLQIGIPLSNRGQKLILTSRERDVCNGFTTLPDMSEIRPLSKDNEAWELFQKEMVRFQDLTWENVIRIKEALMKELGGLPLAISRLARTLGNTHIQRTDDVNCVWRIGLDKLIRKPISDKLRDRILFNSFKNSYDNLTPQAQCCLQYCALFPKDHVIDSKELIDYWMWEGLLGDFDTLEQGRDEGIETVSKLKNAHILQEADNNGKVKLLSLVRSLIIDTMVMDKRWVCIRSGGSLNRLPLSGPYWNANVERASFMKNKLEALDLKEPFRCPKLCTLLLQDNPLVSDSYPDFFSGMTNLKVLDLSRTDISTLPKSLSNLKELRALLLRNCAKLTKLPSLSKLLQLIVLDLSGTPLKHCPEGIQNMVNLRRLDLSQTKLATFPADVVGRLVKLEELLMPISDHGCVWGLSEDRQHKEACIEDLLNLRKLALLQLHFQSVKAYNNYIRNVQEGSNVPSKFLLYVGEVEGDGYVEQNNLTISGRSFRGTNTDETSYPDLFVTSLGKLKDLQVLDVSNLSDLSYLFSVDIFATLTQLRELRVRSCEKMVEIVHQPAANGPRIYLPCLIKMVFFDLPMLKSVCRGRELNCPQLISMEARMCENLKLPMISTGSDKKIQISGEESWFGSLEWDKLDNTENSDPRFVSPPDEVSYCKLYQYLSSCFLKMEAQQCILREVTERSRKKLVESAIVGNNRANVKDKIWELVSSANLSPGAICIHGTLGVGKTAIAVAIHNSALKKPELFDSVVWANLKYGGDLWQVQEDIARSLRINISDIPLTAWRARRLHYALTGKRRFLLILDSMEQPFSLQEIGIPELVDGKKLIVTSRIRTVWENIRAEPFELKPLTENEALDLIENEMRSSITRLDVETLNSVKSAIAELDGLPLPLSNLAQKLGSIQEEDYAKSNREWMKELSKHAREAICLQHRDQELFNRFKRNYENLRVKTRYCFMYCALFPKRHDIESKELIEQWMWQGLLGSDSESLDKRMKKGRETLEELKNAHLLQSVSGESTSDERVNLLSLVRSMATEIAATDNGYKFFIKSGCSLTYLPKDCEWPPEVEIASFMHNQLTVLRLIGNPNCKCLSTLLLQNNSLDGYNMDSSFFVSMPNLRVLDMSRTWICSTGIPNSLFQLKSLHALLLRNCSKLKRLPDLSNLGQLAVLDLSGTPLEHFPKGIQNLSKLRRLDLSQTKLASFPAKVVDKLIELEELIMITDDNQGYAWHSNELDVQWQEACIEELLGLEHLSILQINFLNADVFNLYARDAKMCTAVPRKFHFCLGECHSGGFVKHNSITDNGSHSIALANGTSELHLKMCCYQKTLMLNLEGCFKDLNVLDISYFSDLHDLFSVEILTSLKNLSRLSVSRCKTLKEIIRPDAEFNEPIILPPLLTTIILFDLPNLESICHRRTLYCSQLRLEVWRCEKLKHLGFLNTGGRKICIKGQSSWIHELRLQICMQKDFGRLSKSNSNLILFDAPEPSYLEATAWVQRDEPQEGRDRQQTNGSYRAYISTLLAAALPASMNWE